MDGGAIQMEFLKLELDYYPCHRVSGTLNTLFNLDSNLIACG